MIVRNRVVVLHHLEGMDWDSMARRMGRTMGAVRMVWTRALKQQLPPSDDQL